MSTLGSLTAAATSVPLAALMATTSVRKFRPGTSSIVLRDRLGVAPALWTAVGVPEACAAAGLVIGLWWPALGIAAASGTAVLMAGAVGFHLRAQLLGKALIVPAALCGFAVVTAVVRAATA